MSRPNILWITTDQQRFDTLGCYGNEFVDTPTLDALATAGVRFERAFCQSPVCAPSRASFLTGWYPRTTRLRQNGQAIPEDERLVTKRLADEGYTCGLAGKLHLGPTGPDSNWTRPMTERRIDDGYADFHWSHGYGPRWSTNEYHLWLREQGVEWERTPREESEYVYTTLPAEYHQTTWCAQRAINFIENAADFQQPWLYSVNIFDPHHGFDPPEAYLQRYLDRLDGIPLPNRVEGELKDKSVFQWVDHRGAYGGNAGYPFPEMDATDHRMIRAAYWGMVDLIDDQVGRLLEVLERTGQREDTIVVFTSDHGEMLGDHGIYLKGPYFYEPAIRVPLIVAGPGVEAGVESDALVELVDLAPTLLDAAGLREEPGMQGRSLWPILRGEADADRHRDRVYCEYYNALSNHDDPELAYATMVRTNRYKLVRTHRVGGELYDLREDPIETRNRWDDPAYADVKADLLAKLADSMAETVDPLPEKWDDTGDRV